MAIGEIVSGVGNALGGLASLFGGESEESKAAKKAAAYFESIGIPPMEAQKLVLEKYASAGTLTPELQQTFTQGDTELGNIATDPRLKQAQMEALASLGRQGQTGLSPEDLAALNMIKTQVATEDKGNREAILQNRQARGMAGSGDELAATLAASQGSATRAAMQGDNQAAMAQQARLAALSAYGGQAGQMEAQDFSRQSQVKSAQDAINRFNTANRQTVAGSNVDTQNDAAKYNLTNAQSIANKNVDLSNTQQSHNVGLGQQSFDNQMKLAGAKANAVNRVGAAAGQDAANKASGTASVISGLSGMAGKGIDLYNNRQTNNDDAVTAEDMLKQKRINSTGGSNFGGTIS